MPGFEGDREVPALKYLSVAQLNKVSYPDSSLEMQIGSSQEDDVST